MSMRRALICALLCCLPGSLLATDYAGTLEPRPVPDGSASRPIKLDPAAPAAAKLPSPPAAGDRLFTGELPWGGPRSGVRLVLVEPAAGDPVLWADADLDGALEPAERFPLGPPAANPQDGGVVLELPLQTGAVRRFPVLVRGIKNVVGLQLKPEQRALFASSLAMVQGTVDVTGQPTRVAYALDPKTGRIEPRRGWTGMDADGDGTIDRAAWSAEWDVADGKPSVFRVRNGQYVSTKSVDLAQGTVVLRSHPAADYRRIEVAKGAAFPDVTFTDFEGRPRKLSELQGKHVLLEFWATWCVPCIAELPTLKEAYAKYRARGFEIVGVNFQDELPKAKALVAKEGLTWPMATAESTGDLVDRLRIHGIPQSILLDPEGRVAAASGLPQASLRGADLLAVLEELLPAKGPAPSGR